MKRQPVGPATPQITLGQQIRWRPTHIQHLKQARYTLGTRNTNWTGRPRRPSLSPPLSRYSTYLLLIICRPLKLQRSPVNAAITLFRFRPYSRPHGDRLRHRKPGLRTPASPCTMISNSLAITAEPCACSKRSRTEFGMLSPPSTFAILRLKALAMVRQPSLCRSAYSLRLVRRRPRRKHVAPQQDLLHFRPIHTLTLAHRRATIQRVVPTNLRMQPLVHRRKIDPSLHHLIHCDQEHEHPLDYESSSESAPPHHHPKPSA